jgi:outer membrane protein assembly factor BamB
MSSIRLVCVAAVACVLGVSSIAAQEWSRFRGPNGTGVSYSDNLPVEFGPEKSVEWVIEIPFARSSPVLTSDRIYLTAIEAEAFITMAIERETGKEIWRREIERDRESEMHHDTDSATPSPVTDGARVFAFFQETGLVAYSASGEKLWQMALGPFRNFYGMTASPILAGDTLLLVCDQNSGSFLLAVDKNSGKTLWRQDRPGRSLSYTTPVLYPDAQSPREVVVLGDRWVDAYDLGSGESRWALGGLGVGPISSPVLVDDWLFVNSPDQAAEPPPPFSELTGKHDADGDGILSRQEVEGTWMTKHFGFVDWDNDGSISESDWKSLNSMMGSDDWGIHAIRLSGSTAEPEIVWSTQQSVPYIPTGIVYRDVLYMVKDGIVSAYDPATGDLYKRGRLAKGSPKVYASIVAGDGKLYIGTLEGEMAVLKAGPEWEFLVSNDLEDEIWATPAISDDRLYVRTRGKLFSFVAAQGVKDTTSP